MNETLKNRVGCWLYDQIPGAWHKWTLAVLAVSQADADKYVKTYNGGGRRIKRVEPGNVKADCGAVTPSAEEHLRLRSGGAL